MSKMTRKEFLRLGTAAAATNALASRASAVARDTNALTSVRGSSATNMLIRGADLLLQKILNITFHIDRHNWIFKHSEPPVKSIRRDRSQALLWLTEACCSP